MKETLIVLIVLILAAGGAYYVLTRDSEPSAPQTDEMTDADREGESATSTATTTADMMGPQPSEVIGTSANDHDITAYHYGDGDTEILFVGGIHGGYEWNTVLVAQELMDYLEDNPDVVPENVMVTVVPVLNPDGLNEVIGTTSPQFALADVPDTREATVPGRFNGNDVDLNRNFACDWQAEATWQQRSVSGGDEVFSEPEARAIRDYVTEREPDAAVVWYSAAGGVFSSSCHDGVLPETNTLTNLYADASGYPAYEEFDFYAITGDMVNWLASIDIPAISVLLTNHEDVEWDQNRAGVEALFEYYSEDEDTEEAE